MPSLFLRPLGFIWRNSGTSIALWPKLLTMPKSSFVTNGALPRKCLVLRLGDSKQTFLEALVQVI